MKHRVWKNIVPYTNFHEMDLAFSLYDNTMQSLRYLIDSTHSKDHHLACHPLAKVLVFLQTNCGSIFSGQYFSGTKTRDAEETETLDDLIDLSTDWNVPNANRYTEESYGRDSHPSKFGNLDLSRICVMFHLMIHFCLISGRFTYEYSNQSPH
jgi:hypothetical protein